MPFVISFRCKQQRRVRALQRPALRRHRQHVSRLPRELHDGGVDLAVGVREPLHGEVQEPLEREPRRPQLEARLRGRARHEVDVAHRVRADVEAIALEHPQLSPGHPWRHAPVREAIGDDVRGGVLAVTADRRARVGDDVAIGVVERDHHRARRQAPAVHQRVPDLHLGDRVVAVGFDPRHLPAEDPRGDRQRARHPGQVRRDPVDAVVHQDREGHGQRADACRQPQRRRHRVERRGRCRSTGAGGERAAARQRRGARDDQEHQRESASSLHPPTVLAYAVDSCPRRPLRMFIYIGRLIP